MRFGKLRLVLPFGLIFTLLIGAALVAGASENDALPTAAFHSVRDHGAAGDGKAKDTAAIQKAVDAAHEAGGGTVHFPPGTYLTGTIVLKSNVTLDLDTGATLLGSTDLADYPKLVPKIRSYTDHYADQCLIYGEDVENVAIVGRGTIDGQGASFKSRTYKNRPYMIRIFTSRHVLVEGVTLRHSPMWVQHYLACEDVTLRGLTVISRVNRNNDMIDIDGCRNVRIADCYGVTGDDTITLKSTSEHPCENVSITNCVVSSRCNGIKMGTETHGGFKNVTISNCTIFDTGLAGIALEIVDGGTMDGVTISNVSMRGVQSPIFMRLGNRARLFKENMEKPGVGMMRDVNIDNVVATGARNRGCPISGLPGHPIENVSLSNIRLTFAGAGKKEDMDREIPEEPARYPECTMFGTLPAYGFFCRHVDGLTLRNVDVRFKKDDGRPALFCNDVKDLRVTDFTGECIEGGAPMMVLNDVDGALIRGCLAPENCGTFLRLGGGTRRVSAVGNNLARAAKAFEFTEGTPSSALHSQANRQRK